MPPSDAGAGGPDDGVTAGAREGGVPVRRTQSTAITREQLERVIRRASDLQFRSSTPVSSNLDPEEVVRIGEEVGLDARHVQQAMAEIRAEALVPAAPEDGGLMLRIAGSAVVRVSRVVPGEPAQVEQNIQDYLREKELLKPVRTKPGHSLWEPTTGVVSSMRRQLDVGGHGYTIATAKCLQVAVEPLESGWALVTLTADMSNVRRQSVSGWLAGFGMGGIGGAAGLIIGTGGAALAVIGAIMLVGGAVVGATAAARADVRRRRLRMELVLMGLLDRLERGETLEPMGEPWHQKLLRSARIADD